MLILVPLHHIRHNLNLYLKINYMYLFLETELVTLFYEILDHPVSAGEGLSVRKLWRYTRSK